MNSFRSLIAVALLLSVCVSGSRAEEGKADPGRPLRSSTGAVFRSLFVPGWGQWYCDQKIKSAVFFITESTFIWSISWNHDKMKGFQKSGDDALKKFHENQRNRMIWWLAGVTLLSMGDAYVDAHLYGLDISPDLSPAGAPELRLSKKF